MSHRSKYHMSKVAFQLPKALEVETTAGRKMPDELVGRLLDLDPANRYESEDICTPYLLIIDCEEMPSKEWVRNQQGRVDKVLADYCKEHDIKP